MSRPGVPATLRLGTLYFLIVFGAGFVLAPVRELLLAPRIGQFRAELAEMPVMAVVIWFAAGWISRRPALVGRPRALLTAGLFALGLMLMAELGVVWLVRAQTLGEYLAQRDPVTGSIYLALLLLFAVLPALRAGAARG